MTRKNLVLLMLPSLSLSLPLTALADDAAELPEVVVHGAKATALAPASLGTADTAALLGAEPGVSVYSGGGVSGLPALRGLADDRIKVLIDGAEATAACGNHMNAPLSYIDPTQVSETHVIAGLSPVSAGGDNIAGIINVESARPVFAQPGAPWLTRGWASVQSRSVDHGLTSTLSGTAANDRLSLNYSGATTRGESYQDGHGDQVLDTLYKSTNQALTLATRGDGNLWVLKAGEQLIAYQGFPNQFMDMTHNRGVFANLGYEGTFTWGKLDARLYGQNTLHAMGFFSPERTGSMPMNTHGRDLGYTLQAELPWRGGSLRIGNEYHRLRLDDWWPPVSGSMMMSPDTYVNINGGQRDRLALYGEWEGELSPRWSTLLGLRDESVRTNAGEVQGYGCGMMCSADNAAAVAFNAADRARRDNNIDLTLLARYEHSATSRYEFGFARKTRSPNLYERYSWGRSSMAMSMIGWFGDGNGYVGQPDLQPETAHTLSATADWHDAGQATWGVKLTPFYTYVRDYIDVDPIGSFHPYTVASQTSNLLQFANHDAHLYGLNLSGRAAAWSSSAWGVGTLQGKLDWTRGQRNDGGDLYHLMPLNLHLALEQTLNAWTNRIELVAVAGKTAVDARRLESQTGGYTLVNLGTRYQLPHGISLQAGVRNLFDRYYALPLGGVNLAALKAAHAGTLLPLAGQGRSIDLGVRVEF